MTEGTGARPTPPWSVNPSATHSGGRAARSPPPPGTHTLWRNPVDIVLYRADARGRLNLEGVLPAGVEHFTAEPQGDGSILLRPVTVKTTSVRRSAETDGAE